MRTCLFCGKRAYSDYCVAHRPRKPIRKVGRKELVYRAWRDSVAIPHLDKKYGRKCVNCGATSMLDVDHIKGRGSHPHLKMELTNVQYLCRNCHITKTVEGL